MCNPKLTIQTNPEFKNIIIAQLIKDVKNDKIETLEYSVTINHALLDQLIEDIKEKEI